MLKPGDLFVYQQPPIKGMIAPYVWEKKFKKSRVILIVGFNLKNRIYFLHNGALDFLPPSLFDLYFEPLKEKI